MNVLRKLTILAGMGLCPTLLVSQASFADTPAAAAAAAAAHDAAVWQKHEYSFVFMGFTSTYSCDGLADKLKVLLTAAGARSDAKSQAGACASGFGRPDKFARANLVFYTLAPAAAAAASDAKPVDAAWIPVTLSVRSPRQLADGDCELVEQFRNNVLPMFTTRNIENHMTCIPHQISGSTIDLKFEALAPAARGQHAAAAPAPQPGGT
jgi:hypothetical protein